VAFCSRSVSGEESEEVLRAAQAPDRVRAVEADVANPDCIELLIESARSAFGRVDSVVANAAASLDDLSLRLPAADWDVVMQTNLVGTALLARAAIRAMLAQGARGNVVLISSISRNGAYSQAGYATGKGALEGLCRSIAAEFGPLGVACNVLVPGFVRTSLSDRLPEATKEQLVELCPLRRPADPGEIAAAALFLAGVTPAQLNGQCLQAAGGLWEIPA
jgi:NAD(P)-dependent dehydrogenase (short-subunit alcohol dehydrogenase family)